MPTFTPPPAAPQRGDRATFSSRVDAFLTWLVGLIPQLNTFVANLNARDVGGANTFVYSFDGQVADADPGPGRLRLGSLTQNISNVLRLDLLTEGGTDISAFLATLGAVTSNTKGSIRLQKVNDPNAWLLLDVTAVTVVAGYRNLSVSVKGSSSANPFLQNDAIALFIDRNGDKGDSGGTPTQQQIRDAVGIMGIANGGTGSDTAAGARANLGVMASSAIIPVAQGGTGATTAAGAITALGAMSTLGGTFTGAPILANGVGLYGRDTGNGLRYLTGVGTDNVIAHYSASQGWRWYSFGSSVIATLTDTGAFSAVTVTQTSDERKKKNWQQLTDDQLDALADMDVVGTFDWIDGSGRSVGGSAQQIQAILPEAVLDDGQGNLSVNYGGLCFAVLHGMLRREKAARLAAIDHAENPG